MPDTGRRAIITGKKKDEALTSSLSAYSEHFY